MSFELHNSRKMHFAYYEVKDRLDESSTIHGYTVAQILFAAGCEEDVCVAGMLHDIIEDSDVTYEHLIKHKEFNKRIADLVLEVTHEGINDAHGYYFPRLQSREGIMIKFADRLSNLNRISAWDDSRQKHFLKHSKFWRDK